MTKAQQNSKGQWTMTGGQGRTCQIKSTYTPTEQKQLKAVAESRGVTLAELQRAAVLKILTESDVLNPEPKALDAGSTLGT